MTIEMPRSTRLEELPDSELVELIRTSAAPAAAYSVLWQRHAGAGTTIASRYRTLAEPDDVVAEAFARIFSTIKRGKGPTGAFRPYLAVTIANVAKRWGSQNKAETSDELDTIAGNETTERTDRDLDGDLAVAAFRALPERWQQVLWHSEVEGLGPSELAPILGINANATAALSHRARVALRTAFIELHLKDATAPAACAAARRNLAGQSTGRISARASGELLLHLSTCADCRRVDVDVRKLLPGLAGALLPLLLGGSFIPSLASSTTTTVTAIAAPVAIAAKVSSPFVLVPLIAAAASIAVVVGIGASALNVPAEPVAAPQVIEVVDRPRAEGGNSTQPRADEVPPVVVPEAPPAVIPGPEPEIVAPPAPPVVTPVVPPIEPPLDPPAQPAGPLPAPIVLSSPPANIAPGTPLDGTGTPGATVTIDDARGIPITTAVVDEAGNWSAVLAPLSTTISSIEVRQFDELHPISDPAILTGFAPMVGSPFVDNVDPNYVKFAGVPGATVQIDEVRTDCVDTCPAPRSGNFTIDANSLGWWQKLWYEPGAYRIYITYLDEHGSSAGTQVYDFVV